MTPQHCSVSTLRAATARGDGAYAKRAGMVLLGWFYTAVSGADPRGAPGFALLDDQSNGVRVLIEDASASRAT